MVCAIARGRPDIGKLLIGHGADYNAVFWHPPTTVLSHAIEYCREDIVEHLRSLNAIMPGGQGGE
jgi:ankyrin repeat protein